MAQLSDQAAFSLIIYRKTYEVLQKALSDFGDTQKDYFEEVLASGDLQLMQEVCDELPENYWQFEFRRQIRRLESKEQKDATQSQPGAAADASANN